MAEIKGGRKKRRKGKSAVAAAKEDRVAARERAAEEVAAEARTVRVNEFLTVAELAELVEASATEIIGSAFRNMGLMVTINQRLDFDQIELLLEGFGYQAVRETDYLPPGEEVEEVRLAGPGLAAVLGQLVPAVEGHPRLGEVPKEDVARRWGFQSQGR